MIRARDAALSDLIERIDFLRSRYGDGPRLVEFVAQALSAFTKEGQPIDEQLCRPSGDSYVQNIVYVAPDRGYSVVALAWAPGQSTSIHDHRGWCVVSVYRGCERETRYELESRNGVEVLVESGAREICIGDVAAVPAGTRGIHRVSNCSAGTTVSLHVYGLDVERFGSSIARRFEDVPVEFRERIPA